MKKGVLHKKLSVVVAVHNEEKNLPAFFSSIKPLADEVIVIDGESSDRSVELSKEAGAKIFVVPNQANFHINKQIGIEKATCEWILLMDADEILTPSLVKEIREVVDGNHEEINLSDFKSFVAHMRNIEVRDGITYPQEPPIQGYFIARKNYFLGTYLMHSGVYPDGVIRLFRNGKGYLPCKSVHEQVVINGGVSWLKEPMIHMSDPTFERYVWRANRYTDLTAKELASRKVGISPFSFLNYMLVKPLSIFLLLFFRHKGFMDGFSGFVWALMSALHYPIAYLKYIGDKHVT